MVIKLETSAICIFRMLPTNVELFKNNQPTNQQTAIKQNLELEDTVKMKYGYL